jgi:cation diffusion facilitator CzcD-associated flavoprotein CzcO
MANNKYDVAIIGAGIIGAAVGYCEAVQGHDREPMHYRLEYVDRGISLGTFSRPRAINQDSSFSVLG